MHRALFRVPERPPTPEPDAEEELEETKRKAIKPIAKKGIQLSPSSPFTPGSCMARALGLGTCNSPLPVAQCSMPRGLTCTGRSPHATTQEDPSALAEKVPYGIMGSKPVARTAQVSRSGVEFGKSEKIQLGQVSDVQELRRKLQVSCYHYRRFVVCHKNDATPVT